MPLADTPAVQDHVVTRLEVGILGRDHLADEVDAWDHGEAAHHRKLSGNGEPVFVVDGGMTDADDDVALHQVGERQVADFDELMLFRVAVDDEGFEGFCCGHTASCPRLHGAATRKPQPYAGSAAGTS